ncbi:MAG: DHH family phosphoesterase, partial [Desulfobacteraceae bacterium]
MINQIIDHFQKSQSILVSSHANPDGDAIGALLATGLALKAMHKDVQMYNQSVIPAVYRFLPAVRSISNHVGAIEDFDSIVVLDCGSLGRVGEKAPQIHKGRILINIDHHMTNTRFGDMHLMVADRA